MAHHILEHMGDPGYFIFLQELYRVCVDGALIHIRVPHHRHENFLNDPTHRRPITVEGLRLFSQKWNNICIANQDGSSRLGQLYNVDFELVNFNLIFDSYFAHVLAPSETDDSDRERQIQHLIRTANNVIVETEIDLMVVK
jgi:hypothetical protein